MGKTTGIEPHPAHVFPTAERLRRLSAPFPLGVLTREKNEVINAKDEREGKPVARRLAPMISEFIRAQWRLEELEGVDDERRRALEEAAELDHIWGAWEAEEGQTNVPDR